MNQFYVLLWHTMHMDMNSPPSLLCGSSTDGGPGTSMSYASSDPYRTKTSCNDPSHLIVLGSRSDHVEIRAMNIILVYLQDSENPILAGQDWDEARQVFWGYAYDVIDFIPRQEVILVLAVAVVVVDVTCTHEKVSTWDVPGKGRTNSCHYSKKHKVSQWSSVDKGEEFPTWRWYSLWGWLQRWGTVCPSWWILGPENQSKQRSSPVQFPRLLRGPFCLFSAPEGF